MLTAEMPEVDPVGYQVKHRVVPKVMNTLGPVLFHFRGETQDNVDGHPNGKTKLKQFHINV